MPPPRKKRPPAGQSVPDAGTISAHRDALRRSSGAAGQKPPERGRKNSPRRGPGLCTGCAMGERQAMGVSGAGKHHTGHPPGQRARPGAKTAPGGGRRLSGCGIWVLLAPGDPCDLDAQGGQHSQAEDHAQLSQGEICHQEQAMQSGDQQHSQEQQHAHAEGSQ